MATSPKTPERVVGPNPETPPVEAPADEVKVDRSLTNDHDRIVMASRRVDGSINESDPEFIGPVEDAVAGAAHQKEFQARAAQASAQYAAANANRVSDATDERDDIAEKAQKDAEAEVKKLHKGFNS